MTTGKCQKIVNESTEEIKSEVVAKTDSLADQIKRGFENIASFFKRKEIEIVEPSDDYFVMSDTEHLFMPEFKTLNEEESNILI